MMHSHSIISSPEPSRRVSGRPEQRHHAETRRRLHGRLPASQGRSPKQGTLFSAPAASGIVRLFLVCLAILLAGYGILGRSFAYLGVAPIFVGELCMGLGLIALLKSGGIKDALSLLFSRLIIVFSLWSLLVTIPYFPQFGMTTLRDAVLWGYSLWGIIVAGVMIGNPQSIRWLLLRFRSYSIVFVSTAWLVFVIYKSKVLDGFGLPGSPVDLFEAPGGELLVQLSGVAAFVAVGMTRNRLYMVPMLLLNMGILMISKRAGMLAFMGAFGVLLILNPPRLKLLALTYALVFALVAAIAINPRVDFGHGRVISMEQLTENVVSTFDQSSSSTLETTKSWRLDWWSDIFGYTFGGEHFVFGKGYGINLATDDGYQVLSGNALRSPHNAHLNVLARSGVPGFLLWLAIHGVWSVSMFRAARDAKRRKMLNWHGIFAFVLAFWIAFMINASFDVFLESPIGGIWIWSLMGFGIGALHIYRTRPELGLDSVPFVMKTDTYIHE